MKLKIELTIPFSYYSDLSHTQVAVIEVDETTALELQEHMSASKKPLNRKAVEKFQS